MEDKEIEKLWNKLLEVLLNKEDELHTVTINSLKTNDLKGKWFTLTSDGNKLLVLKNNNHPEKQTCNINKPIAIKKEDFLKVSRRFDRWRRQEIPRTEISNISWTSSYILAIYYKYNNQI